MKKMFWGILLFTLSATAFAANDIANLKIKGKVDATTTLTFKDVGQDATIDVNILSGTDNNAMVKAVEESNSRTGYRVSVTSEKNGLQHANISSVNYGYKLYYGDKEVAVTPGASLSNHELIMTTGSDKKDSIIRDVGVKVDAQADAPSGDYSDTLILTISTNS